MSFVENDPENKTPAPQPLAELESSPPEQQQEAPLQQPPPPPVAVVAPKPNLALTFVRNVSPRKPSAEAPPPPARPPSTKRSSTSPAPVSVAQPKVIAEGTRKASTLESAPAIAEPSTLSPSKAKENAIIATDTPAVVSKKRKASEEGQGKRSAKKQRNWETPLTIKVSRRRLQSVLCGPELTPVCSARGHQPCLHPEDRQGDRVHYALQARARREQAGEACHLCGGGPLACKDNIDRW